MTQLELDALMNAENLDEIIQEEPQKDLDENDMVHQLSSVTVDSEKKATEIMAQLDQVLVELDAIGTCIDDNEGEKAKVIVEDIKNIIFDTMSMMQYQDIHRQKIERVINTMVSISTMMNNTLQDVVNIAPSAKHIDDEDGDSVSDDELAELIAKMGNN
jgi:hypothetical protein